MWDVVLVKLTDHGRALRKIHHGDLSLRANVDYYPIKEDEQGRSEWQMHTLMHLFGEHLYNGCQIYNGCQMPFDPSIEILNEDS